MVTFICTWITLGILSGISIAIAERWKMRMVEFLIFSLFGYFAFLAFFIGYVCPFFLGKKK